MRYREFTIIHKEHAAHDTYVIRLKPQNPADMYDFRPGQHAYLKFGNEVNNNEGHPFSIASSPTEKEYVEFCVKILGDWTAHFVKVQIGDPVAVSDPAGTFIWNGSIRHAVFIAGGVGISPFMSMLRYITDKGGNPDITLIWGNRDQNALVYEDELRAMQQKFSINLVHVFSHLQENSDWKGYRGFVTKDIIRQVTDLTKNPVFFLNGPPIFITHTKEELKALIVPDDHVRTE